LATDHVSDVNNTWMYDVDGGLCPNDTSANYCNVFRGGIFDDTGSSTFSKAPDVATAGGAPGDNSTTAVGPAVGGSDTIQLNSTTSLTHFPIGFLRNDWGNGTYPMNSIGFGLNSTLLSWLKSAGHIGSRTYSIFWGLAGASGTAKMDGSVVLGGYDNAKILGKKYLKSFSSRETCETGMMVEITDIQLNFPKGLNQSIMPSGTINACIVPNFPTVMSLPDKPYYENFENLTGMTRIGRSVGINYGGLLYSPQNVYAMDDIASSRLALTGTQIWR
jgi:hypothetical protein